ncbi:hypothetical protein GA0070624_1695 [Micromonospora rhizosphaerae]|uniref:Uncharacterized protein n=1 Tax=Micromonospora rhizosphaerae TaxID=568872 RepID=A0A1C6RQ34_9ACTN|nr:hypothetical protein [Micromonospora rhizosphaerae]SCL19164.1 hypothetical protein GA0070624_1695 [Micromonospora rhizosphaerae]
MRTIRLAASALIVCAALSACGGQGASDGAATPTGAAPVTSQPSPDPTASDPVNPVDPMPTAPPKGTAGPIKPPPAGATTLTGTIQAGVEPNCLLLDGNLLLGGPRDVLRPGARVIVTGRSQPDLMTTCQQGTPFVVETARPA